jgi:signal transduction histidine kinase
MPSAQRADTWAVATVEGAHEKRRWLAEPLGSASSTGRLVMDQRGATVTGVAVAFAFGLLLLPTSDRDYSEIGVAAVIGVALITLSVLEDVFPRLMHVALALGFILMVGVLRDGAGGGVSGFGGLFLLPIVFLALASNRAQLVFGLAAMAAANVVPLLVVGAPKYPLANWRGTFVQVVVAAIAGLTIQKLVSTARHHTTAISAQNERLRDLDRLKDEFLSLVSHELRTPLTSIRGYLELVRDDPGPRLADPQCTYLEIIERNAKRLSALVEDLLYVARLDAGRIEIERTTFNLREVLVQAVETAEPAADARSVALNLCSEDLPDVSGDRRQVAQLVDNLVSNAVKFTSTGGRVLIEASRGRDGVHVAVTDTGVGIPAGEISQLFTRFYRASTAANAPGTGLGLAISQSIAEAHGTVIDVSSRPGVGSTFSFTLPL